MYNLQGKYGKAKIFADVVESSAVSQIILLLNQPASEGADVAIMPDVHAGAGCVIGYTAKVTDKIIPNLIGVDIGCGVLTTEVDICHTSLNTIDDYFKLNVPTGFKKREVSIFDKYFNSIDRDKIKEICERTEQDFNNVMISLGTLGGGNHFAEIGNRGTRSFFSVHTGSRNFGLKVALYHQKIAQIAHPEVPRDLAYLEGTAVKDYLDDMKIAQLFAQMNRKAITDTMNKLLPKGELVVESVHNYIDIDNGIIRKGAISAEDGKLLVIPLNMRDGTILGIGKSNAEWNFSAPHGAGRVMSRSQAKKELSMDEFKDTMDGIYSTSVNLGTLDESPMAYKKSEIILESIKDTVDIINIIKPVWNAKG